MHLHTLDTLHAEGVDEGLELSALCTPCCANSLATKLEHPNVHLKAKRFFSVIPICLNVVHAQNL